MGKLNFTGWVILILVLLLCIVAGSWVIRYYTAEPRGKVEAEEQIESGSNRIVKYNHFFDMCARAQEVADKLDAQYAQLDNTEQGSEQYPRIQTRISGLHGEFSRVTRKYNADARKDYTAARFRDSDLPFELPTDYERGRDVSCNG